MEATVVDRNPDIIKQEIDQARSELALTVDALAERANPRRLADDIKIRAIDFLKRHVIAVTAAGVGTVVVVLVVHRARNH